MMNVIIVTHIMRPERLRLLVPATAPAIEANTIGTTMQNIMRIKIVPKKAILPAKVGYK